MIEAKACSYLIKVIARFLGAKREVNSCGFKEISKQTVIHKSFGKGVIRSVDEKYLEVDFMKKRKISKFSYSGCFHGFLTVEDSSLQPEIEAVVEVWKQESGAVQKEELKKQYEKTMQSVEARRLTKILNKEAFDKKGLIYGMGHAVYTLSDPREKVFKGFVDNPVCDCQNCWMVRT